jgi:hypothetical protein
MPREYCLKRFTKTKKLHRCNKLKGHDGSPHRGAIMRRHPESPDTAPFFKDGECLGDVSLLGMYDSEKDIAELEAKATISEDGESFFWEDDEPTPA